MKDKMARLAIEELASELGFGKPQYYGALKQVSFYPSLYGDTDKMPVPYRNIRYLSELVSRSQSNFKMLIDYLGLEVFEGRELRKKKVTKRKSLTKK